MKRTLYIILYIVSAACFVGCTDGTDRKGRADTLYTAAAAMEVFDQDPERAMAMVDSGVAVGNIEDELATLFKARFYSRPPTTR